MTVRDALVPLLAFFLGSIANEIRWKAALRRLRGLPGLLEVTRTDGQRDASSTIPQNAPPLMHERMLYPKPSLQLTYPKTVSDARQHYRHLRETRHGLLPLDQELIVEAKASRILPSSATAERD
jgi:hypothetical protein